MSTHRARGAALAADVATPTEKVMALDEDFERALEKLDESDPADGSAANSAVV